VYANGPKVIVHWAQWYYGTGGKQLTGREANVKILVPWPHRAWSDAVLAEALKAFDEEAYWLARWCMKSIPEYKKPIGGHEIIRQADELGWKLKRTNHYYQPANDRLVIWGELEGER